MKCLNKLLVLLIISILTSCTLKNDRSPIEIKDESKPNEAETIILMHNRKGLRIEYNLNKKKIELWISPQAGKSVNYKLRNFSNRDDHTCVFDRIYFPNLKLEDFTGCDYDPFHSVVHFKDQQMHIVSLFDKPVVIIWFEKNEMVDLKTDKADKSIKRDDKTFMVEHPDRGLDFTFVAALGEGNGTFIHQNPVDEGRSIYARASLQANQPIYFSGELSKEPVLGIIESVRDQKMPDLLSKTNSLVDSLVHMSYLRLKKNPELQKLIDMNKRIFISMQDESGAIRASMQYIYYLIWVRDGGMSGALMAGSGFVDPLDRWIHFQLANPSISEQDPKGRFFGQLVNGKISKWEEDGIFYVIWSAFSHWTQTGDTKYITGSNLKVLEDAMDWLERYCYNKDKKLFGRYHYCESPLENSYGWGWDQAVGNPSDKYTTKFQGEEITRSYDIYMNMICYSSYFMLSAMQTDPVLAATYMQKAKVLEEGIRTMFRIDDLPDYGTLITEKNKEIFAPAYGMDKTDYIWGLTLPFFFPDYSLMPAIYRELYSNMMNHPRGYFFAGYFPILQALDIATFNQDSIMYAVEYAAKQCYRPGKFLPMPNTMIEMSDQRDGDPYHDIRPQAFTIGTWLPAMTAMGVRRMPFGIALRNSHYIESIDRYEYKKSLIDIEFRGTGKISRITLNDTVIKNTLQVPENMLKKGKNKLVVEMNEENEMNVPMLMSSTLRLDSVSEINHQLHYVFEAFGKNVMVFKNMENTLKILDMKNQDVVVTTKISNGLTYAEFEGRGKYKAVVPMDK